MEKLGIDISTFQNGINLKTAKEEGVEFVILRGSYTGYASNKGLAKDDRFESHYSNAIKNKLGIGVYHFSRATTYDEGKKEAEFLYNNCLKNKVFEYPIYIDVEDNVYQAKAGRGAVTNAIKGFCEYIEEKGFYAGVYCNLNWAKNYMNYDELSKKYDFWLAYWGNEMPRRNNWGNYGIWQFGGETNLIRGNTIAGKICDQNYCYKDYPSIMKYNKLNNVEKNLIDTSVKQIKYTVKKGDTLYSISKKYGTTVNKIYNDNKKIIGNNPNLIKPGQILIINK